MSIDRVTDAQKIIAQQLQPGDEFLPGCQEERGGRVTFQVRTSPERAADLAGACQEALTTLGPCNVETTLSITVDVGGVRSL